MKKSLLILGLVIAGCAKNNATANASITNFSQSEITPSGSQPVVIKEPDYTISNNTGIITFAEYTKDSEKYDYSTNEYFILYEELYGKYFSKENLSPHIRVRNGDIKPLSYPSDKTNFSSFKFPQAGTVITYTNEYGISFFNEDLVFDPEFVLTIPESQYGLSALYSRVLFPYFCEAYKNEGYFRKNLILYWDPYEVQPSIRWIIPWFRERNSLMGMISGISSMRSIEYFLRMIAYYHLPQSARDINYTDSKLSKEEKLELMYYIFYKIFPTNNKEKLKITLLNYLMHYMFNGDSIMYTPAFEYEEGHVFTADPNDPTFWSPQPPAHVY